MPTPTSRRWRALRAGAFALLAGQIAVGGHAVAGSAHFPSLPLLAVLTVLLAVLLHAVGTRRWTWSFLLPVMAGVQVVFHLLLTLNASGHSAVAPAGSAAQMWLFHAVAAVLSSALLAAGERLLFALADWFARLRPRTPDLPAAVARRPVAGLRPVLLGRPGGMPAAPRGPPVAATA